MFQFQLRINRFLATLTLTLTNTSSASLKCDYGGLQTVLRNSADKLHAGNPVRYIDFANDAPFSDALKRMQAVDVPEPEVQTAWAKAIKKLCGDKAENITDKNVGPTQTLTGLMNLLEISE